MKRLLTYLGLLAALLIMPVDSKAETWSYYLNGDHDNWARNSNDFFGETSNSSDEITWTKTFTGAELDPTKDGQFIFNIYVSWTGNGSANYPLGSPSSAYALSVNTTVNISSNTVSTFVVSNIIQSATYTIKFVSSSRNAGTVTVEGPEGQDNTIYLRGSFSGWANSKAPTFNSSTGIYTWEYTPSEFPPETTFKMVQGTGPKWYGAYGWTDSSTSSTTVDETWKTMNGTNQAQDMKVSYDATDVEKVTIQVLKSSSNYYVKFFITPTPHDYYWVSPQVTNSQKLESFKMVASRNRSGKYGDGEISSKFYSFTLKADDIKKRYDNGATINTGDKVQWYIVRDDDQVWYRPTNNDPTPSAENSTLNVGSGDNNVGYRNFNDCKTTSSSVSGMFSFLKGYSGYNTSSSTALSYTFILNSQTTSDASKGNVYFNYAKAGASTSIGYYLIGNFTSASTGESIQIGDTSHPLTKYWYKAGEPYTVEQAQADSIVYKTTVTKPAGGWGNLYLDVNPSGNTDWGKVYRPLISLGNTLDGRALVGGVTTAGQGLNDNAGDQSLNPETSDRYTGYTFSFNATTYTYRLEFHTSLYLVGPGVSSSEGLGSWNMSNVETSDPRIRLTATQEAGHYRNRVYFTQGQEFRFIQNTDEAAPDYSTTWHENNNAPKWMTAISDGEYTPGSETQYKNSLDFQNGTGNTGNTAPSGVSVTFDLPTGWYYVNFYENTNGTPYYTIEKQIDIRDFNEVTYNNGTINETRNIKGRNGYNFFRVWSDHIAWTKPADIDVFVVTAFSVDETTGQATVTLAKQNNDYIPAKTGVILASADTKNSFSGGGVYKPAVSGTAYNTAWIDMTPAAAPANTYSGTSKLTPLYEATNLQRFINEGGTDYANYLFGFYRCKKINSSYSGADNDFDLGFWLTTGVGNTYANSAFLRILKSDAEKMGVGTSYTMTSSSPAPAFFLVFEEEPEPIITGIKEIEKTLEGPASDKWYTLEGVRVAAPSTKGIYIHGGKKFIIK